MNEIMLEPEEKEKVFEYLDDLRESGVTNMFGAPAYLIREFGYKSAVAQAWVSKWMKEFSST